MEIIKITKKICDEFVSKKHYSRTPSIFWAGFALIENDIVQGVCVFGQPSPPIQRHAFKDRTSFRLYELSRLVVQSKTENASSFLVSHALKMLDTPCAVISYADTAHNHCGFIYQATNWAYTGSTISHDKLYLVEGVKTHPMTLRDRGITDPTRWAKENNIETIKPSPKHRYFYFCGNRRDKKEMLSKLSYPIIKAYPKSDPSRYDDGEKLEIHIEK